MKNPLWKRVLVINLVTILGMLLLAGGWHMLTTPVSSATAHGACTLPNAPEFPSKVGLYVLAFDSDPLGQFDLSPKYHDTVERLTDATATLPDSIVVILADLNGVGDTHLVIAVDGVSTRLDCLPTAEGTLDPNLRELDTADGQSLANFLVWGRTTFATGSSGLVFSYIGHGNPVTPYLEEGINAFVPAAEESQTAAQDYAPHTLSPLPSRLGVNPSLTDHHAPTTGTLSLITPHDLAVALAAATNNGASRFDLIDLLHCFAATVDELVELAPYADGIIASPNYAFFDPAMPGATFEQGLLEDVLLTYGSFHPITGHPHILMGIETDTVIDVTDNWQIVTDELLKAFAENETDTAARLLTAYQNSIKYDTTVCEQQQAWVLAPPDSLSDMKSFAAELQTAFSGQNPTLQTALANTINALEGVILQTVSASGEPYFTEGSGNNWQFLAGESGISLFTPFQTAEINGEQYLPWQSLWYTSTTSYSLTNEVTILNPQPFQFIVDANQPTWADVVHRFWVAQEIRPGVEVNTFFCTAELLGLQTDAADLALGLDAQTRSGDMANTLQVTLTVTNSGSISASQLTLYFRPHTTTVDWLTFQASDPAGVCQASSDQLICNLEELPVGAPQLLRLNYQIDPSGFEVPFSLLMQAEATAATFDPITANNSQRLTLDIQSILNQLFLPLTFYSRSP